MSEGTERQTGTRKAVIPPPGDLSALEIKESAVVPLTEAPPERRQRIRQLMCAIDLNDSGSILFFGAKAQEQVTEVSDSMLDGVRNKDTGPAGGALNDMLATIRGFDVSDIDPNDKPGFFGRLLGKAKPAAKLIQRYETVKGQIDDIADRLDRHTTELLTDIATLDRLYEATLAYFHDLADYIAAGETRLAELDSTELPAREQQAKDGELLAAQALRDLRQARDELERRVHDLKLTRQVAMQALPSIRLVQENDKSLTARIRSTVTNTVPLWRQQLAIAVTLARAAEAGGTLKEASDLTNQLLTANAESLRSSNRGIRTQVERGVFDIEAVEQANANLTATIEDSLRIADEGKAKRADAEARLAACESDLKQALAAAKARAAGIET
ncbi:MAG: toxic anion resistance protein [Rhodospirillales bacterium]|nr:toxic anion resistance protein [Rhodospirillales bacterium]